MNLETYFKWVFDIICRLFVKTKKLKRIRFSLPPIPLFLKSYENHVFSSFCIGAGQMCLIKFKSKHRNITDNVNSAQKLDFCASFVGDFVVKIKLSAFRLSTLLQASHFREVEKDMFLRRILDFRH